MSFERFVASRYLRARRKQVVISFITLLSVLGVTTGVAALIIVLSLYSGLITDIQQKILGATAHITLFSGTGGPLEDFERMQQRVLEVPGIAHVTPAVFVQGLVNYRSSSTGVILKGIRPAEERRLLEKRIRLHGGDWADLTDGRKIMMGDDLASSLGVPVGGFVNLIVPQGGISPLGLMPRIRKFQVVGVFHTGLYDLDHNWAYLDLEEAQRLAAIPANTVQCLEVRTDEIYEVAAMEELLDEHLNGGAVFTNWIEKNQAFFSALTLEKWSMFLAIGLIVLVAALNIITTLIMMVMEKNKDIAILRAMGATGRQIMRIFIWQGLMIGIIGAVLGSALGVGLSWAADKYQWISLDAEVYMIAHLPFRLDGWDVLLVACSAVIVSFLATLYPSRQAARIDPVEVIRYG